MYYLVEIMERVEYITVIGRNFMNGDDIETIAYV